MIPTWAWPGVIVGLAVALAILWEECHWRSEIKRHGPK